jgi:hypothetical protein
MPTPKWLTGRTRTPTFTVDFSLEAEWAPIINTSVHYVKYGRLLATVDGAYLTSPTPTFTFPSRGPYVTITPRVRKVSGSDTFGASPYKPDSPEGYRWEPSGDPAGGWVEVTNWPLYQVEFGYDLVIFGGDNYATSINQFIPVGSPVTVWAPGGVGSTPGPMGGITYSGFGVPSGVTIPTGRACWTIPDDWERTGGTTYSGGISGTITFSGGAHEEYFLNSDEPTARATGFIPKVQPNHISEVGDRDLNTPGPPYARQYAEQRASGSTQSITVSFSTNGGISYSSYNLTTAPNASFNYANFLTPYAEASSFTHTLGTSGSATSAGYTLAASYNIGGVFVSPVSHTFSNSGGSVSTGGGTANSETYPGSPTYPTFFILLPGGGQAFRGGIKIGNAATRLKIPIPREMIFTGQLKRLPDVGNDISYDLLLEAYNPSAGATLTVLDTISGITTSFSRTYRYDDRATTCATGFSYPSSGFTTLNGSGASNWFTSLPSTYPTNAGLRLGGANVSGVATRRLCIRGKRWVLYRAFAPNQVPIAPDSAGTWQSRTDGSGMTTSIVSGKLRLVSTAAAYTRLVATTKVPEYRMHKIRVRSVGSANQSLRIRRVGSLGSPAQHIFDWTISTGVDGDWVEIDLDPLASYTGPCHTISPGIVIQNSNYWQFDTAGVGTIEIEWFRAIRRTFATLDCVRRRLDLDPAAMVGTLDGSPYSLTLAPSDEIEDSFGGWDFRLENVPSAAKVWGYTFPWNKIIDLAGPFPQADWYDADNYDYVAGAGLLRDEGTWVTYLDRGAGEPGLIPDVPIAFGELPALLPAHAVPAQEIFERVILYPGCGDVFGVVDGSYGVPTTLHYGLLLGSAVHGLEIGEIEDGADWPDIVALDGSTERARGVVAGDENYGLLTPDLRNGVSYSVRLDPEDDTVQRLTTLGEDKVIFRTVWLIRNKKYELEILRDAVGRLYCSYLDTSRKVKLSRVYQIKSGVIGAFPETGSHVVSEITTIPSKTLSLFAIGDHFENRSLGNGRYSHGQYGLVTIKISDDTVMFFVSSDHGESWVMETIPGTYTNQRTVVHETRLVFFGWRSNNWYVRVGAPRSYTGVSGSDSYDWSAERLVVATTNSAGSAWVGDEGLIQFGYIDSSGVNKTIAAHLANNGTGTWA